MDLGKELRQVVRYSGLQTFMQLPHTLDVGSSDIAVVGIPFDSSSTSPGTRYGPRAIRHSSRVLRFVDDATGVDPRKRRRIVDYGDLQIIPGATESTHRVVREQLTSIYKAGAQTLALGGDHGVTLPELRACHAAYPDLALIHFDSHCDTYDSFWGGGEYPLRHNSGTVFRRAADEGLVDTAHSIQIGMRGTLYTDRDFDEARDLGFEVLTTDTVLEMSVETFRSHVAARTQGKPVFLSFDMDVFDPGSAPGVGSPEPGGPTSREVLRRLRSLQGQRVVASDVVEVCPPLDVANLTSILGAYVAFQLLVLMSLAPRDD